MHLMPAETKVEVSQPREVQGSQTARFDIPVSYDKEFS